jgi:hypothetical protein
MVYFSLRLDYWHKESERFLIDGMGKELEYYDKLSNADIAYFLKIETELFVKIMETKFNAKQNSHGDFLYFDNFEDGERAIEWVRSIQTMEKLIE